MRIKNVNRKFNIEIKKDIETKYLNIIYSKPNQ